MYPPSIWYILNEKAFSDSKMFSVAYYLRDRWLKTLQSQGKTTGSEQTPLYYGEGGDYTVENLQERMNLINELQTAVTLINQELQVLLQELTP